MKKKSTRRTAEAVLDAGNPEWTSSDFAKAVSFVELPADLRKALGSRGLQKAPKKVAVSIRLSPEVAEAFRASGPGWQSRVNEILRAHIK